MRISLFHKCGYYKWHELINAQAVCRALRKITSRHWQTSYKKYRTMYEFYQQQLSELGRDDRKELNDFIERNGINFDIHKIRALMNEQIVCLDGCV